MSRVIKNNDGVAIVEGTPAASLVKDVDKFFAAKPPERMAGERIAAVRRDTMITGKIKDKDGNEIVGRKPTGEEFNSFLAEQGITKLGEKPFPPKPEVGPEPEPPPRPTIGPEPEPPIDRRNEAKEKAMARRERVFQRRRSSKEADRSQREQEATRGKFITTLGR